LRNFRALVALLLALAIALFIVWIFREFGLMTGLFVLSTTILSQWITLFGHNLFYFIWASFLPLGLMACYLALRGSDAQAGGIGLAAVAFGSMLFKCLMNGYDFIIPALCMPVIPFVYYAVRNRWSRTLFVRRSAILLVSLAVAVATSLLVLALQLRVTEGNFMGGIGSLLSTFGRRTYADPGAFPAYADSLAANPWTVLWTYISEDTAIEVLNLRFLDIIIAFAVASVGYVLFDALNRHRLPTRTKAYALIAATWAALISPVSWFLIFKGQAYVHTHTNYLAWHMPFTLFGYAMCAYVLRSIVFSPGREPAPTPLASSDSSR
jgi:hypothetical protein